MKNKSQWCLYIYHNGKNEESKEYVPVYLILLNTYEAKDLVGKITLTNSCGFREFVKKDFLIDESNSLLMGDKLTILCEAEITDLKYGNHSNQETSINIMIPQSKISLNYGIMFESSIFTVCSINIGTTEI
uniref:Speckle-type POZ protein-like (inferred by orthology to a human protein) n=1 Tax=Strongyloides venezuelensis TaxID=75913 RepID=A0A0K0EU48_STRVS